MLAACNTTEETANLTEDTNAKQQLHLENLVHLKKSEQNYLKTMQKQEQDLLQLKRELKKIPSS